MTAWTHTLHLLWVLALLVPRIGLAMPGDVGAPPDCPGHGQAAASAHLDSAHHAQADVEKPRASENGCGVDCLLTCGLAGLQAGIPTATSEGEPLPDIHPAAQVASRDPVAPPASLFRPPRP